MGLTYASFNKIPNEEMVDQIVALHTTVFGESDDLPGRMSEKPNLRIDVAIDDEKLVGYKIGYALNREQFYSWLGGVDPGYRNKGIASELMKQQHEFIRESGYYSVQTKTKNQWRSMLILNIKSGFYIIGTFTDSLGEPKIILEKKLQ
ncbi:GNAT family N-acetyltransferase [Ornithinibacillus contaminans]|uniref:GNAT family N-acetyltransferase n=1 Tax=Ornithinibacillus contaminans TaxID=694055 RepID=UPI00064E03DC|nr:GNAT family N-acetyltransferase [Ornithinibacillus contaminans]